MEIVRKRKTQVKREPSPNANLLVCGDCREVLRKGTMNKNDYTGTIIEESLSNKEVLKRVEIISTKVSPVTEKMQTPWLKQWALHKVRINEVDAGEIAKDLSTSLQKNDWYADYKNPEWHYIVFSGKIFKIKRDDAEGYQKAKEYGLSLGIPEYQVDFSPEIQ